MEKKIVIVTQIIIWYMNHLNIIQKMLQLPQRIIWYILGQIIENDVHYN